MILFSATDCPWPTDRRRTGRPQVTFRRGVGLAAMAAGAIGLAACGSGGTATNHRTGQQAASGEGSTAPAGPSGATTPSGSSSPAAPGSGTSSVSPITGSAPSPGTASSGGAGPTPPVLGRAGAFDPHSRGFGQVEPSTIDNGGDPTGLVTGIHWSSWGSSEATGTGTGTYVGPNQVVAQGRPVPATVVAFDLGSCHGRRSYQAVEWYFPSKGGRFDPRTYEDPCTGTFVSPPTSAAGGS